MRGQRNLYQAGQRYGMLVVVRCWTALANPGKKGKETFCECRCDCDNIVIVRGRYLRNGLTVPSRATKSCGCLRQICNKEHHAWKGHGDISASVWSSIRNGAKRRRTIEFKLTIEEAWALFLEQNGKCALSGVEISFPRRNRRYEGVVNTTASLDRIDSSKPYEAGNVQWVHKEINLMKMNLPQAKFVEWCSKVTFNRQESNTTTSKV